MPLTTSESLFCDCMLSGFDVSLDELCGFEAVASRPGRGGKAAASKSN